MGLFTDTVPDKHEEFMDQAAQSFAESAQEALPAMDAATQEFYKSTVPEAYDGLWDEAAGHFDASVAEAAKKINESTDRFFDGMTGKVDGLLDSTCNSEKSSAGSAWDKVMDFFGWGDDDEPAKHAKGGIMTRPHVGLVAEDGAEAIIPLSGKHRDRGLAVWETAGRILGAGHENAESETPPAPIPRFDGGASGRMDHGAAVNVGNISFEVRVDGGGQDPQALTDAIQDKIRGMTDEIAYQLATALQKAYANTPKTAWDG